MAVSRSGTEVKKENYLESDKIFGIAVSRFVLDDSGRWMNTGDLTTCDVIGWVDAARLRADYHRCRKVVVVDFSARTIWQGCWRRLSGEGEGVIDIVVHSTGRDYLRRRETFFVMMVRREFSLAGVTGLTGRRGTGRIVVSWSERKNKRVLFLLFSWKVYRCLIPLIIKHLADDHTWFGSDDKCISVWPNG